MKAIKSIGSSIGDMFKKPEMPKVETPVMPDPNSEAAKLAAKKRVQARQRGGRQGTIFSDYSNSNLGATA